MNSLFNIMFKYILLKEIIKMKKTNLKELKLEELENVNGGGWMEAIGKGLVGIPFLDPAILGGPVAAFYK